MGSIYKRRQTYWIKYYDNGKPIYKSSKSKTKMVESIQNQTGFSKTGSLEIVETLFEIIKRTLKSSEDVLVFGFGKFCVMEKKERKSRSPATGEDMMLEPRKVVTFKCSGKLRDRINGN